METSDAQIEKWNAHDQSRGGSSVGPHCYTAVIGGHTSGIGDLEGSRPMLARCQPRPFQSNFQGHFSTAAGAFSSLVRAASGQARTCSRSDPVDFDEERYLIACAAGKHSAPTETVSHDVEQWSKGSAVLRCAGSRFKWPCWATVVLLIALTSGFAFEVYRNKIVERASDCCHTLEVECRACRSGMTVEDYCASAGLKQTMSACGERLPADRSIENRFHRERVPPLGEAHEKDRLGVRLLPRMCSRQEHGKDYTGDILRSWLNVESSELCCSLCSRAVNCTAWTWNHKKPRTCHAKTFSKLHWALKPGVVSGLSGTGQMTVMINNSLSECLDAIGVWELGLSSCNKPSSISSNRWFYDELRGTFRSERGSCLGSTASPVWKRKVVRLEPCVPNAPGQRWHYDGIAGRIEDAAGLCLEARARERGLWQHATQKLAANFSGSGGIFSFATELRPCSRRASVEWGIWRISALPRVASSTATTTTTASTNASRIATPSRLAMKTTLTTTTTTFTHRIRLFCFSFLPHCNAGGNEKSWEARALFQLQAAQETGIFACDDGAIYATQRIPIGSINTKVISFGGLPCHGDSMMGTGEDVSTIFVKLWDQVFVDGQFRRCEWTAKVQADAVFLPWRLRFQLTQAAEPAGETLEAAVADHGAFLLSCEDGLHEAVQVVSREALEAYGRDRRSCSSQQPRESVYLRQCFATLGVKAMHPFELLARSDCRAASGSDGLQDCEGGAVAFYPHRTVMDYNTCLRRAGAPRDLNGSLPEVRKGSEYDDLFGDDVRTLG